MNIAFTWIRKAKDASWRKTTLTYSFVVAAVAVAAFIRFKIDPWIGSYYPFVTFLIATTLIAYFYGNIPSLVCSVLGYLVANYYFVTPRHFFIPIEIEHFLGMTVYFSLSLLITFFFKKMHDTHKMLICREHQARKNEQTLRQNEAWLRLSQQAALCASFEWNITTGEIVWSEEIWNVYGIEPHSLKPSFEAWVQMTHHEDRQVVTKAIEDAVAQCAEIAPEWRIIDAVGNIRWFSARASPQLDTNGQLRSYIGIVMNITDRKRAEEALQQAKTTAEQASKAKSQFLSNMSHELRTPLNGIMGLTDLVLMTPLSDQQRKNLVFVKSSADHLLNVINQILDLSKIEAGYLDLKPSLFTVRQMVDDLSDIYRAVLKDKQVTLKSCVEDTVPTQLVGDPMRLTQILHNLLSNAVKFTSSGSIELTVALAEKHDGHGLIRFSVKDTGIGIAGDAVGKLFTYFSQASEDVCAKYGGTGLGLAISKLLVEKMGGEISVKSEQGKGSTFYFTAVFGLEVSACDKNRAS